MVEEILELRGDDGRVSAFVRSITDPGALADTGGYSPDISFEQKVELLETLEVTERLELALRFQRERLAELQVRRRIRDDVQEGAERQQREYFLRKQMESIRRELGDDDASVVEEYRTKIEDAGMPDAPLVSNRTGTTGMDETLLERLTRARRDHVLAGLHRIPARELYQLSRRPAGTPPVGTDPATVLRVAAAA